jgi:hypothetical protein
MSRPLTNSPTGWWIAGILERQSRDEQVTFWNNYRLVRAEHWRDAFRRALAQGSADEVSGRRAFRGDTTFMGVTELLPIYDAFEDGAELWWQQIDGGSPAADVPIVFSEDEMEAFYEQRLDDE